MATKAALKAAKSALDSREYATAIEQSNIVLSIDTNNHFARLFIGRANEKLGKLDEAANSYILATQTKPEDSQAWLGLRGLYEAQEARKVDEYLAVSIKLAEIYMKSDDQHRCQSAIDKAVAFSKKYGTKSQYRNALEVLLPGGPVFEYLEGRIQQPSVTYLRIAEITENEETQAIKNEIADKRTRIGAKLGQVTAEVKQRVYSNSKLEYYYQQVIDWSADDEVRRQFEEKLLQRAYDVLVSLPVENKATKLDQVLSLAEGMVIIHHPFQLAWDIVLESRDLADLKDLDADILTTYKTEFPDAGLTKIFKAWLTSELSPFPIPKDDVNQDGTEKELSLSPEDRLVLMAEGISASETSPLAHRLVADYYLHLDEYESTIETCRAGSRSLYVESQRLGMSLQNTQDALNSILATALVHYQAPRHHAEGRRLFEAILKRKPQWTAALIGLGLIFEENQEYDAAIEFLSLAMKESGQTLTVAAELAWCKALNGRYEIAEQELEACLLKLAADDPRTRDLKAQILYRIGRCKWELGQSKSARKDRDRAYKYFIGAIKANVNFAPAYTSLGYYYADYGKDRKRGRQCFQKAFELSPSETDAAKRLASYFAERKDWHIVEVIAQRVIDSGRARPPPGSRRKGISWPFSAMGVVQMNKLEYQQAITSFLAALRISPDDYQSYVGLGESYHNSGRYNSALRTFSYALSSDDGPVVAGKTEAWFAKYMMANVRRELGDYEEAIDGLRTVLTERPDEFGVLLSILQTFIERSWRSVAIGLYGQAISSAREAINVAVELARDAPSAFNLWKAIGDACHVFSLVVSSSSEFPFEKIRGLLLNDQNSDAFQYLANVDQVDVAQLDGTPHNDNSKAATVSQSLVASILSFKRAIYWCSHDTYAQAVAWYNLGLAEHTAYLQLSATGGASKANRFLQAAVRCFKRAIELEAGNSEFWNALGVVTSTLNPKVAQHSFVRSLHLNELNAKVWTNLGVLYLLHGDLELSHQAFGRAQSTDPDFAHAWIGEGLIATLTGNRLEALNHFTHAFEISDSSSTIAKRQYSTSVFDHVLSTASASNDLAALIQPSFALEQLTRQIQEPTYEHLAALFFERVGNFAAASVILGRLCDIVEEEYESSESLPALGRFAQAKADRARVLLALKEFEIAAENAETALDLSSDPAESGLEEPSRIKLRLSAHLTAGLAYWYLQRHTESISMFKLALQESDNNPDIIALLVRVLWKHGGNEEQSVAREQLFSSIETHPEHSGSAVLLGAIAALDQDNDTVAAVVDDVRRLLTSSETLSTENEAQMGALLADLAALELESADAEIDPVVAQAQAAVMLAPNSADAWSGIANQVASDAAAQMALRTARTTVPPLGSIDAYGLAEMFANAGTVGHSQRAIMHAPWSAKGWQALAEGIKMVH